MIGISVSVTITYPIRALWSLPLCLFVDPMDSYKTSWTEPYQASCHHIGAQHIQDTILSQQRTSESNTWIRTHVSFDLHNPGELLKTTQYEWRGLSGWVLLNTWRASSLANFGLAAEVLNSSREILSLLIEFRDISWWISKLIENVSIVNIILKLCISGYHILQKREICEKGTREYIVTERLGGWDRSNQRNGRSWRILQSTMLLW